LSSPENRPKKWKTKSKRTERAEDATLAATDRGLLANNFCFYLLFFFREGAFQGHLKTMNAGAFDEQVCVIQGRQAKQAKENGNNKNM
jgi:hypothetical protein